MTIDELHAPLVPILRYLLPQIALPQHGIALDLAAGAGHKLPLLAEYCGPAVRLLALDYDAAALAAIPPPSLAVVADAHALPLGNQCCDAVVCIAAYGLFADKQRVLREARRVLRHGAPLILVTSGQLWALRIAWPTELAAVLATADLPLARVDHELDGRLHDQLSAAGFTRISVHAVALDEPNPRLAALQLLGWPALHALLAPRLSAADLAQCEQLAANAEPELCHLALVAVASD